ncbi:MAG: hypothetical protein DWQ04_34620, partial [Chloroflexi bacterium]
MCINGDQKEGIVFLVNHQGTIQKILHDGLNLSNQLPIGSLLTRLVVRESRQKVLNFFVELQEKNIAFNWEVNVQFVDKSVKSLHITGSVAESSYIIVGAQTISAMEDLYKQMMSIHNEQTTLLRAARKMQSEQDHENNKFDEISRLNNELVNLQRELNQKNKELERLDKLKNQFLGMAAHDLRNPLAVIRSYSEFLLDEAADVLNEEHFEFVQDIQFTSHFMLGLVNDLLDISTIESGNLILTLFWVDPIKFVQHSATTNQILAGSKQITIQFEHDDVVPNLYFDKQKVAQVLNNLISNAVKYSEAGSRVFIKLSQFEKGILVAVRDEGPGIPPDEFDKLFKPFSRTSVQSTGGEKSTGVGLLISR